MKNFELNVYNKSLKVERTDVLDDFLFEGKLPGVHYYVYLNDLYKVSIIKRYGSYGYEDDTWEIALIYNNNQMVSISEDFDLFDDVIGYLTEEKVNKWITLFYEKYVWKES